MSQIIHPTTVAYQEVDLSWLMGRRVGDLSFHQPARWLLTLSPDADINIECLWRIIKSGRVMLTSEDHEQQFGLSAPLDASSKSAELLAGKLITSVQLREATADLVLEFGGDLSLEIIPTSAGYESWQLHDPSGKSYVAQGGGQLCAWQS